MGSSQSKKDIDVIEKFKTALNKKDNVVLKTFIADKKFCMAVNPENEWNALMYAIADERSDVADLLINNGSSITVVSKDGNDTALSLAISNNLTNIAQKIVIRLCSVDRTQQQLIFNSGNKDLNTPFMAACMSPQMFSVASTIWSKHKSVININTHNNNLETHLMLACSANLEAVALEMINMNSSYEYVNYSSSNGRTARDYAVINNLDSVVRKIDEILEIGPVVMPTAPPLYMVQN